MALNLFSLKLLVSLILLINLVPRPVANARQLKQGDMVSTAVVDPSIISPTPSRADIGKEVAETKTIPPFTNIPGIPGIPFPQIPAFSFPTPMPDIPMFDPNNPVGGLPTFPNFPFPNLPTPP